MGLNVNFFSTFDHVMNDCENDCDLFYAVLDMDRFTCQTLWNISVWSNISFCVIILSVVRLFWNARLLHRKDLFNCDTKQQALKSLYLLSKLEIPLTTLQVTLFQYNALICANAQLVKIMVTGIITWPNVPKITFKLSTWSECMNFV